MQAEVRAEGLQLVVVVDGGVWFRGCNHDEAERFLSELLGLSFGNDELEALSRRVSNALESWGGPGR